MRSHGYIRCCEWVGWNMLHGKLFSFTLAYVVLHSQEYFSLYPLFLPSFWKLTSSNIKTGRQQNVKTTCTTFYAEQAPMSKPPLWERHFPSSPGMCCCSLKHEVTLGSFLPSPHCLSPWVPGALLPAAAVAFVPGIITEIHGILFNASWLQPAIKLCLMSELV